MRGETCLSSRNPELRKSIHTAHTSAGTAGTKRAGKGGLQALKEVTLTDKADTLLFLVCETQWGGEHRLWSQAAWTLSQLHRPLAG